MASKSDLVAEEPLAVRDEFGAANLHIGVMRYRDFRWLPPVSVSEGGSVDGDIGAAVIPACMNFVVLEEADPSDPLNQLRVYCLKIGDRLAYKVTFADSMPDSDIRRLAFMAFVIIATEHSAEIRDAIAAERG